MLSQAILLASSPTACAPIPSATIYKWPRFFQVSQVGARTIEWLSWLLERRIPVSVATASMMMSSQFTTRPCEWTHGPRHRCGETVAYPRRGQSLKQNLWNPIRPTTRPPIQSSPSVLQSTRSPGFAGDQDSRRREEGIESRDLV